MATLVSIKSLSMLLLLSIVCSEVNAENKVTLYQPDFVMKECISDVTALATYIQSVTDTSTKIFEGIEPMVSTSFAVVVGVKPLNKVKVWMVTGGNEIEHKLINRVIKQVSSINTIPISCEIFLFATSIDIGEGGIPLATPSSPIPIPEAWKEHATEGGTEAGSLAIKSWDAEIGN